MAERAARATTRLKEATLRWSAGTPVEVVRVGDTFADVRINGVQAYVLLDLLEGVQPSTDPDEIAAVRVDFYELYTAQIEARQQAMNELQTSRGDGGDGRDL